MVDSVASLSDLQIAHELMVRTKRLSEHMEGKKSKIWKRKKRRSAR